MEVICVQYLVMSRAGALLTPVTLLHFFASTRLKLGQHGEFNVNLIEKHLDDD